MEVNKKTVVYEITQQPLSACGGCGGRRGCDLWCSCCGCLWWGPVGDVRG